MTNQNGLTRGCFRVAVLGAMVCWTSPAAGVDLGLSTTSVVARGESGPVCVSMIDGRNEVAGLQLNLVWDDSCVTPTDGRDLCRADPATGKNAQSALLGRGELKTILISFSDVEPIPDGPLLCCDFTAVGKEGKRCAIRATNVIGSTSTGVRLDDFDITNKGLLTIASSDDPGGESVANAQQGVSDDGCALAPVSRGSSPAFAGLAWVGLLLMARSWRRRLRR